MRGREKDIINEIEILKKVSRGHPSIIKLHDYFETPNNLYLVMDLCTGGELFDRIIDKGSFYEEDAAKIVKSVIEVVWFLHSQDIVHRDIKPENILLRHKGTFDIVISDFGLSKIIDTDEKKLLKTTVCF
jgi:calcium/calmodulin-dependent protein kinase I